MSLDNHDALDLALEVIEYFEGFSSTPYQDTWRNASVSISQQGVAPEGIWTIGKGTTIYPKTERPVGPNDPRITEAQADQLILEHIAKYCLPGLSKLPGWARMKNCQQGSLISFSYNTGYDRLGTHNFDSLDFAIEKAPWKVPKFLMLYDNHGTYGLTRRRYLEGLVWMETPVAIAIAKTNKLYPVN